MHLLFVPFQKKKITHLKDLEIVSKPRKKIKLLTYQLETHC